MAGTAQQTENQLETPEEEAAFRQEMVNELWSDDNGVDSGSHPLVMPAQTQDQDANENDDDQDAGTTSADDDDAKNDEDDHKPTEDDNKPDDDDPWAGVNPALRQVVEGISNSVQTMASNIETRVKQAERRIGSLTNELHAAKTAADNLKKTEKAGEKKAPSEKEMAEAAKTNEGWEDLKSEFPQWADALEAKFAPKDQQQQGPTIDQDQIVKQVVDQVSKKISLTNGETAKLIAQLQADRVAEKHPDYVQTVKSQEYVNWYNTQPANVQQLHRSNSVNDAIKILDMFESSKTTPNNNDGKKSATEIAKKRKKRLQAAETTDNGKPLPRKKNPDDMTDAEYRAQAAKEIFGGDP